MKNSGATSSWFLKAVSPLQLFSSRVVRNPGGWQGNFLTHSFVLHQTIPSGIRHPWKSVVFFSCHCCPQLKSSLPHLPRIIEFRFHNTPFSITSHVNCLILYSTMPLSQPELPDLGQKSTNSWTMRWSPLSSFFPFHLPHKYCLSYSLRSVLPPPQNLCWQVIRSAMSTPVTPILSMLHWGSFFGFIQHSG